MNRRTEGQKDRRTEGQKDRRTEGQKDRFNLWVQRLFMLLVFATLFTNNLRGQANFFSEFGDPSGTTCTGGSQSHSFNGRIATTGTTTVPISNLNDPFATIGTGSVSQSTLFQNSMYDKLGQLLFSVNADGIYDNSGAMQFAFDAGSSVLTGTALSGTTASFFFAPTGSASFTMQPTYAVSEISIFPYPGKCGSYYVLFWAKDADVSWYGQLLRDIRCLQVDVDPISMALTVTDGVIVDLSEGPYSHGWVDAIKGPNEYDNPLLLTVDNIDAGTGQRDFYTLERAKAGTASHQYSVMRKWTISAAGGLPSTSYSFPAHISASTGYQYQTNSYSAKSKILSISGNKYFTYVSGDIPDPYSATYLPYGYMLKELDVATGLPMPSSLGFVTEFYTPFIQIYGFEYVPTQNVIYYSYTDYNWTLSSWGYQGLGYWDNTGAFTSICDFTTTTSAATNNTNDYRNTDLELDKDGDLLMVRMPTTSAYYDGYSYEGELAVLPVSSTTPSTTVMPTVINSGCSTHPIISVLNNVPQKVISGSFGYYLGNQIRGDNYDAWGYDILSYTVTGSETWTPTNNPIANVTGTSVSAVSLLGNINIPAGSSLNIQNMAVQFGIGKHVFVDASPASSTLQGGKLTLDNSTLTNNLYGCGIPSTWGGVVLKGDMAQSQGSFTSSHQGAINMINSSTISNANVGIMSGFGLTVTGWLWSGWGFFWPLYGLAGGGLVNVMQSNLVNNYTGVFMPPYRNFDPSAPTVEIPNASYFYLSNFTVSDPALTALSTIYGNPVICIKGQSVKGINIQGCGFDNTTGQMDNTYGIYADNMGFNVSHTSIVTSSPRCHFNSFMEGIKHISGMNTNTVNIRYADFAHNYIGIELAGTQAPLLYGNTFQVDNYSGGSSATWTTAAYSHASSIGVLLNGASNFTINGNTFNGVVSAAYENTAGVLAYRNGSSDEQLNNNTYSNLLAANLSNFKNTNSLSGIYNTGLQILCNTHSNNLNDIAARGGNSATDGIRQWQGNSSGRTGGNIFSSTPGMHTYNLYNLGATTLTAPHHEVGDVSYWFANPSSSWGIAPNPLEHPGVTTGSTPTAYNYGDATTSTDLIVVGVDGIDHCLLSHGADGFPFPITDITTFLGGEGTAITAGDISHVAMGNVNYYMTDPVGMTQRDQLYYWAGQINTPAGDRLLSNLYLEDGMVTEANAVYNNITTKFALDQQEKDEYDVYGRQLMDMKISLLQNPAAKLTATQITNLQSIYSNASVWAKAIARNWIQSFVPQEALAPAFIIMDDLLFPVMPPDIGQKGINNAVQETTQQGSVTPNPGTNTLQVHYNIATVAKAIIELYDITGRVVLTKELTDGNTNVDVTLLENGLYLYKILDAGKITLQGKITKL